MSRRLTIALVALLLSSGAHAASPLELLQPAHTWAPAARAVLDGLSRLELPIALLARLHPATPVGTARRGRLLFGARMLPSEGIHLRNPDEAWGTPEGIWALQYAARVVRESLPGGFDLVVGDLSRRTGGRFYPHRTHQQGLDVDVRYYLTGIEPGDYSYHFVGPENFDPPRVWAFIEELVMLDAVELFYMDVRHQRRLYQYARDTLGRDPDSLEPLLSYPRARRHPDALIQHARGHHNHLHIRFKAPFARLFGALYTVEEAVALQRRVDLDQLGRFEHVVRRGETLGAIAARHAVDLDALRQWNRLSKRAILRPGQTLYVLASTSTGSVTSAP